MKSKQRKRRADRRRAHGPGTRDAPPVLHRESYPVVKKGHIVPACYQRNFAVEGRVAVHPEGKEDCFKLAVENAGTRGPFYRRQRNDGTDIDDVEASLSALEDRCAPVLAAVAAGAPLDEDAKGGLAQFFAMQMMRGPMFFSIAKESAEGVIEREVTPETVKPEAWRRYNGDIDAIRQDARDAFWMQRFQDMIGRGQKTSSVIGCMRWRLLRVSKPIVAYSDQPVVLWPLGLLVVDTRPPQPRLGPLSALEIRVPLSPHLIVLMTWDDLSDVPQPIDVTPAFASETNALVVAQADKQWMHHPDGEPPIADHLLRPISEALDPGYGHRVTQNSQRWARASRRLRQVERKRFVGTVEIITSITRGPIQQTRANAAQSRLTRTRRSRRS